MDLRFYTIFNNILVNQDDESKNEKMFAMKPRVRLKSFTSAAGIESRTTRLLGQRLIYVATGFCLSL